MKSTKGINLIFNSTSPGGGMEKYVFKIITKFLFPHCAFHDQMSKQLLDLTTISSSKHFSKHFKLKIKEI